MPVDSNETIRVPKAAVILADRLRGQIARGELKAGQQFPPEPEMLAKWGIGRPALREALRILESESLLEVRRGNVGGAVVRVPTPAVAARAAGLVLQLQGTTLADVYETRLIIEPAAAGLAAKNSTPEGCATLATLLEAQEAVTDDAKEWAHAAVRFHEAIVDGAGSKTLSLMSAMLSEIINTHQEDEVTRPGPDRIVSRRRANRAHRALLDLIRDGDSEGAEQLWRQHIEQTNAGYFSGRPVQLVVDLFT